MCLKTTRPPSGPRSKPPYNRLIMTIERQDVLSVPNLISAAGFGLVLAGLRRGIDEPAGLLSVAVGRVLDLADGQVARRTGQSSEFGAAVDATLDKAGVALIMTEECRKGLVPRPVAAGIILQNGLNAFATLKAEASDTDIELGPTRDGKLAMAAQNMALGAYALAANLENPRAAKGLRLIGHISAVAGLLYFGPKATREYLSRAA